MVMNDCFFAFFFFFNSISAYFRFFIGGILDSIGFFSFFLSFISLLFTPVMNIVMKDYARGNKRF